MENTNYLKFLLLCLILCLPLHSTHAQDKEEIDMSDVLVIPSPSSHFKSVNIQAHKGLPRFGLDNKYYFRNKYGSLYTDGTKTNIITIGSRNYTGLINMKYLSSYFNDLDKEILTMPTRETQDDKKTIHSFVGQKILVQLARDVLTDEEKIKLFCNGKEDPICKYPERVSWVRIKDEFEKQEKYAAFVKGNLSSLLDWSSTFFKNDSDIGYLVTSHKIAQYDFENGGYWVQLPSGNIEIPPFPRSEFVPKGIAENNFFNVVSLPETYNAKVLLPMTATKAEEFQNSKEINISSNRPSDLIYSAAKVRITFKEVSETNPTFPQVLYTYNFEDTTIEFYKDIALTKKIGAVSLENLTYEKK